MDVFDLLFARGSVFFNLETGVGDERRAIDPTQTNYTMDLSVFTRLPRGELGVTFHHVSRHRADREHPGAPSWNMLGLSYGDRLQLGTFDIEIMGRWLGTVTSSEVDYGQEANAYLRVLRPLTERISVVGELDGSAAVTDESMFGREYLYGGSAHLGLRFRGAAGAGEDPGRPRAAHRPRYLRAAPDPLDPPGVPFRRRLTAAALWHNRGMRFHPSCVPVCVAVLRDGRRHWLRPLRRPSTPRCGRRSSTTASPRWTTA